MTNRRRLIMNVVAAALIALFLPALAAAQGNYDAWGRDRRDNGRNGYRYDNRTLRDTARRLDDRSRDFQRHLDTALDRSRYDGTRREDRVNEIAVEFRNAASALRNSIGDGRNINRSSDEARRVLQLGSRIDQFIGRQRLNSRAESDWSQIRRDLGALANIFGFNNVNGGGYNGGNRGNVEPWRRLP